MGQIQFELKEETAYCQRPRSVRTQMSSVTFDRFCMDFDTTDTEVHQGEHDDK